MHKRIDARSWITFAILLTLFLATIRLRSAGHLSDTVSNLVCAALILVAIGAGVSRAVALSRQERER